MKRFICLFLLVFLRAPAFPQNTEIVPNENLVVEGIPKIPASLAETVERYTNFRGASLDSWDPVKREMLISTLLSRRITRAIACSHNFRAEDGSRSIGLRIIARFLYARKFRRTRAICGL